MSAEYLVRRWRAFVAPSDLLTMLLLLATGARFSMRDTPVLPNSPAARKVYNNAVHLTVDTWPYPSPAAKQLSLLHTESHSGAVLDVLRIMDLDSGTTGQFVSYDVATRWTSPITRLVVDQDRWSCDATDLALYSPVGEKPTAHNTAAVLLGPILDLTTPPQSIRNAKRKTLLWPAITGQDRVTLSDTQRSAQNDAITHHFTDPVWDLQPQAPGTDILFDQIAARAMYTEHTMRVV